MKHAALLFVALLIGPICLTASAGGAADVAAILSQPIIEPDLPLKEVQAYTESRVPVMPELSTREAWQAEAQRLRREMFEKVIFRGAAARWREAETQVQWLETIPGGPGYHIRKLRFEALPGLWIPALLYEPEEIDGKVPVVLNVNGHDGAGKAAPYKQIRSINQAKRGMLALNVEWLGMGQLRGDDFGHYRMNQLDLCGTSGLAPFYLSMQRALDLLLDHPNADPKRVAVAGLSGGGWQTIFISSLDTRVTLADPVAGYSSFRTRARYLTDLGDSEQTPCDMATVADYAHLTAMRAPRPTLLTFNAKDNCCFRADHALAPLLEAARPVFALYGKDKNLRSHINEDPGDHNFELDNREALYRMFADFFSGDDVEYDAREIPSDSEVKTAEQLQVSLPEENANFHSLAVALSRDLPRGPKRPDDRPSALEWQNQRREALGELVRFKSYAVVAQQADESQADDISVKRLRLKLDQNWTVPVVELTPAEPRGTAILLADGGRASAAGHAKRLLSENIRVLAVDPFYFGESKIAQRDFLFALLVAAVGDRPLGIQAGQVASIARWAAGRYQDQPVALVADGPRTSTIALVAAAVETKAIARVELTRPLGSLHQVIENNWGVNQYPELFCFGLLEQFDVADLAALVAPRELVTRDSDERARSELHGLAEWYALWDAALGPIE